MMKLSKYQLLQLIIALACLATELSVQAMERPLTVSPSVADSGQTITAIGADFQSSAWQLAWGGGLSVKASMNTQDYESSVGVVNCYACVADGMMSEII